jgi:energy-coupling factor transporter ATP-binding protein EcfA2
LLQKNINEEDVDGEFYVDIRLGETSSNEEMVNLIRNAEGNRNSDGDLIRSADDLKSRVQQAGLVYLLLGRKGSGKSTILVHFSEEVKKEKNVLSIYLDLKSAKKKY